MGLFDKLFGKKGKKGDDGLKPFKSLDKNIELLKDAFKDCTDIVYREFSVGEQHEVKAALVYTDGLADKMLLNKFVLNNLMISTRLTDNEEIDSTQQVIDQIKNKVIAVTEMKEIETIDEAIMNILSGESVLLIDQYDKIIIVSSKGWAARGVSDPVTEVVVRGSRDAFTETFRVNTALIRRRIRDTRLKIKTYQVGERSNTDVAIMYMEDIVDPKVLIEVDKRIKEIDFDAILDSGYIEQFIEDNWITLFPQIQNTERPDVSAAAILEGRVVIIVDNSPFALIVPTTFNMMMQSAEDYYDRWSIATATRILRYFAAIISLTGPALYVSVSVFHPQMIPSKLALTLAANRQGVPFPAIVEALIMEVAIEILREAGVRLPKPIGATIGIVGGLVIGQAAVEAGIVAPLLVIVVAITAISSFSIPSYNVAIGFRLLRFGFILAAGFLGLYGVALVTLLLLVHLCSLKSFGIPYLSPFVTMVDTFSDLKDTVVRVPLISMSNRGITARRKQKNRMDDKKQENFGKGEE